MRAALLRFWPVLLLPLFLVGKSIYDRQQQEIGRRDAEIATLQIQLDTLEKLATSLKADLAEKVKIVVRTRTVWDTLPPLIPSLQVPDAPPVPAATLAKVILIGTEAIEACTSALSVCQALIPVQESLIEGQARQIEILRSRIPGRWDNLREWAIRAGIFYLGMKAANR